MDKLLAEDGSLAAGKVFDRAELIVAAAPHLYGLSATELTRLVDHVLADDRCVPLLRVGAARTPVFAPPCVLEREQQIAHLAHALAEQLAPTVPTAAAEVAIGKVEAELGGPLTPSQTAAARGLLTSGHGLDLVVGVAGAGKTTALSAVTAGFEAAGFQVLGTATSGQAARGLGEGAGIGESRTLASLTWRLDHDRIRLTSRHVVILNEAGMTEDAHLARLLTAVSRAHAKLIVVGDDRQLGAVGPGGGLTALLARHPDHIWTLDHNVRQIDHAERAALTQHARRERRASDQLVCGQRAHPHHPHPPPGHRRHGPTVGGRHPRRPRQRAHGVAARQRRRPQPDRPRHVGSHGPARPA